MDTSDDIRASCIEIYPIPLFVPLLQMFGLKSEFLQLFSPDLSPSWRERWCIQSMIQNKHRSSQSLFEFHFLEHMHTLYLCFIDKELWSENKQPGKKQCVLVWMNERTTTRNLFFALLMERIMDLCHEQALSCLCDCQNESASLLKNYSSSSYFSDEIVLYFISKCWLDSSPTFHILLACRISYDSSTGD